MSPVAFESLFYAAYKGGCTLTFDTNNMLFGRLQPSRKWHGNKFGHIWDWWGCIGRSEGNGELLIYLWKEEGRQARKISTAIINQICL